MEPRKVVQMNQFAGQKLTHRCKEQTYGHQGGNVAGGRGGGVMNWDTGIDICKLICIKWIIRTCCIKIKLNLKKSNQFKKVLMNNFTLLL